MNALQVVYFLERRTGLVSERRNHGVFKCLSNSVTVLEEREKRS